MAADSSKPLLFISHSVENQSLTSDFLKRFEKFHRKRFKIYHDRTPESGNYNDLILGRVRSCQVAVLLISQSFIDSEYCNEKEVPILMQRFKEEKNVIIIPILFQKCGFQDWNKPHELKFFQFRFDQLPNSRRSDKYGNSYNKEDVVYQELDESDFERYHYELSNHVIKCYEDFEGGQKRANNQDEDDSEQEQQGLRDKRLTDKILKKMKKDSLGYKMEVTLSNEPKLWEDAGIPIPDHDEIYGFRFCLGHDKFFEKLQEDILHTPDDEFPVKAQTFFDKISHRDKLLRTFVKRISLREDALVQKMDTIFDTSQKTLEAAKREMATGIRRNNSAPLNAKSKVIDTIGLIRDWVRELGEESLRTN